MLEVRDPTFHDAEWGEIVSELGGPGVGELDQNGMSSVRLRAPISPIGVIGCKNEGGESFNIGGGESIEPDHFAGSDHTTDRATRLFQDDPVSALNVPGRSPTTREPALIAFGARENPVKVDRPEKGNVVHKCNIQGHLRRGKKKSGGRRATL